jgi:hypothetical protein
MDNPLKPQPLMAEVLPGFTVLAILATAFVFAHLPQISPSSLSKFLNATTVIAGSLGALLSCWVIGTMLDAVRDLVEWVMDQRFPLNWPYLLNEPTKRTQPLEDTWLAYYYLNGNMTVALWLVAAVGLLKPFDIHGYTLLGIIVISLIYTTNTWTLRQEIRTLIGYDKSMPHTVAYTRIAPSRPPPSAEFPTGTLGVGMFAVRDIPAGTLIFDPDDDPTILISSSTVAGLPSKLQKMYRDFCPKPSMDTIVVH